MPRVNFVQCARKDVPNSDIKAGESYYWWKFMKGGKRVSRTRPKPWQLTQSAFLQTLYHIQDDFDHLTADDGLESAVENIISQLEDLRDTQQESLDNMPEQLQSAPTGELLQERIDNIENAVSELQNIEWLDDVEARDMEEYPENDDYWDAKLAEVHDVDLSF